MSTALGIASVTHVLKDLLNDGLINNNVAGAVGIVVNVSSLAPGQVESALANSSSQLNLFLYRVSPNIGWANTRYPSRNRKGEVINNPPLALDLHYLLTAFGESELHSEILLGYGMQIIHENPVLDRRSIRNSLSTVNANQPGNLLPQNLRALADSKLAEQIEQIKISHENINVEEISKLWTAFQSKYRLCTAYKATVVLIESEQPTRPSLPVKERKFYSFTFKQPTIEKLLSQAGPALPVLANQQILVGHKIVIQGKQLKRDPLAVLFNGDAFTPLEQDISDTEVSIVVPNSLKAGVLGIQIAHFISMGTPAENRRSTESNLLAFVLSPTISNFNLGAVSTDAENLKSVKMTLDISPAVYQGQRILLLLNELNPAPGEDPKAYSFVHSAADLVNKPNGLNTIEIQIDKMKGGNYLVRVQVDGAESPLKDNALGKYENPQINIS